MPSIEMLEDRSVPVTSVLNGSILTVTGTAAADAITVSFNGSQYLVLSGPTVINTFPSSAVMGISVNSQAGADRIELGPEITIPSTLGGGGDNDTILGGSGPDSINGGGGNDSIEGRQGNDILAGGTGNDELRGGQGNDVITGDQQDLRSATISTPLGSDTIFGGLGNDTLYGEYDPAIYLPTMTELSTARDSFGGVGAGDSIVGGDDSDQIYGQFGGDTIQGEGGNDTLIGGLRDWEIQDAGQMFDGSDVIQGGDADDIIQGAGGNDRLFGDSGSDTVSGNTGDDSIDGGTGNDSLRGGSNDDTVEGGDGADTVEGGRGNDTVRGGADDDLLFGDGAGVQYASIDPSDPPVGANSGNDFLDGGTGNDRIDPGYGTDSVIDSSGSADVFDLLISPPLNAVNFNTNVTLDLRQSGTQLYRTNGLGAAQINLPMSGIERYSFGNGNDAITVAFPQVGETLWINTRGGSNTLDIFGPRAFNVSTSNGNVSLPIGNSTATVQFQTDTSMAVRVLDYNVAIAGNYTLTEGQSLTLIGQISGAGFPVVSSGWDLDGDNLIDEPGNSLTLGFEELEEAISDNSISFVTNFGGSLTGRFDTDAPSLNIINAPPVITSFGAPSTARRGEEYSIVLAAQDPSLSDQLAGFIFDIDWNNDFVIDQTVSGPSGLTVTRTFEQAGNVQARIRATDINGGVSPWFTTSINVIGFEIIGTNLVWYGTSGNDQVRFVNGSPGGIQIQESLLNGTVVSVVSDAFSIAGELIVNARAGSDTIDAATLTNAVEIDAGIGDDEVWGGINDDLLLGRLGDDTLYGGPGNDQIVDEGDQNLIFGDISADGGEGPASDKLGRDTIVTAGGNDIIYGDSDGGEGSPDLISTGGGDDVIYADGAEGDFTSETEISNVGDTIFAGTGNDVIYADGIGGLDTLVGGNDVVDAGDGDDYVAAGGGSDSVIGGLGNDILLGGDGAEGRSDTLVGEDGRDIIVGDLGSPEPDEAGGGADSLDGGAGQDILISGAYIPTDPSAILAIRSEWLSDRSFAERSSNIQGQSLGGPRNNGENFLSVGLNVFDDTMIGSTQPEHVDAMLGGGDEDLVFANLGVDSPIDGELLVDLAGVLLP